jgi:general stress protein 26
METSQISMPGVDRQPGIQKIKEMVELNPVCFFVTHLMAVPLQTRPMFAQKVSDDGNLWFLSHIDSTLNEELEIDSQVQLLFGNTPDTQFLAVYGKAIISRDRQKIAEIWNPQAKAWFPEGKHSPGISVIKVTPEEAHYWDTKTNDMICIIKSPGRTPSRAIAREDRNRKVKRYEIGLNFML